MKIKKSELKELLASLARSEDLMEKIFSEEIEEEEDCQKEECPCKCEYLKSIEKDFKAFANWAFGTNESIKTQKDAIEMWKKLHADIPIPRILLAKDLNSPKFTTLALLIDAYPYYLKDQK